MNLFFKWYILLTYLLFSPVLANAQHGSEPVILSKGGYNTENSFAIDKDGIIHCVWSHMLQDNFYQIYYTKTVDNGTTWTSSNVTLYGSTGLTQKIQNCFLEELYVWPNSFPTYFKYNEIIDEDNNVGNPVYPLVRYINYPANPCTLDVRYNCWGNSFQPDEDLIGANTTFISSPIWCPGVTPPKDSPIDLYANAMELFDSGNYTEAKNLLHFIVNQYPNSIQAQGAIKELFRIEEFAENDYNGLQQYYLTTDSILANTSLLRVSDYFANRCNEKIGNWPAEINWFEAKIMNPELEADSIFAILDLGYVYFLMENEGKSSTYTGSLSQYKPKSLELFLPYRDSLLSLLPGNSKPKQSLKPDSNVDGGKFMLCYPNPFTTSIEINFKLTSSNNVQGFS